MIAFSIRLSCIDQPSDVSNVFLDNSLLLILLQLFNRKLHSVHTKQDRQLELTLLYISLSHFLSCSLYFLFSFFPISLSFFPYFSFFLLFLGIELLYKSLWKPRSTEISYIISDYLTKILILHELTFNLYGYTSKVACKGQRSRLFSRI